MKSTAKSLIENMGFSPKKAAIYLALLELGESDAASIAKKVELKRTTVYNILPELISEGFIRSSPIAGKTTYHIDSPSRLEKSLEERRESITSLIPQLEKMQGLFNYKPKVTSYEGLPGLKEIYKDFIEVSRKGDIMRAYVSTRNYFNQLPLDFIVEYAKKRRDKGIRLRLITDTSEVLENVKKEAKEYLREIKSADSQVFDFSGETIIYGDKVGFISYKENFLGVIIESKEISAMQRAAFDLLWEKM